MDEILKLINIILLQRTDVDVLLYNLQDVTTNRVLINAVDINGNIEINAVSTDILKKNKKWMVQHYTIH